MENEPLEQTPPPAAAIQPDISPNKKSLGKKLSLGLVAIVIVAVSATSAFFVLGSQQQLTIKKTSTPATTAVKKLPPGTIGSIEADIKTNMDTEQKLDDQTANSDINSVNNEASSTQTLEANYEN